MTLKSAKAFVVAATFLLLSCSAYVEEQNVRQRIDTAFNTSYISKSYDRFFHRTRLPSNWQTHNMNKIAGGSYANDGQFPFMAVVHRLIPGGAVAQCGGTVISKRWVLTAGHCVAKPPNRFFVIFGIINKSGIGYDYNFGSGVSMMTNRFIVHPYYYHSWNDIGLLYMPRDIPYTQNIQPIRLASRNEARETFADQTAYVVGWGRDRQTGGGTKGLKYALMPVIHNGECARYWKVDRRNICTAVGLGQNACQGDSGGPLFVMRNNTPMQIGIVSYGDANCPSGRPGVFTRISTFATWIENVTGIKY